jgi:hypothetical protein
VHILCADRPAASKVVVASELASLQRLQYSNISWYVHIELICAFVAVVQVLEALQSAVAKPWTAPHVDSATGSNHPCVRLSFLDSHVNIFSYRSSVCHSYAVETETLPVRFRNATVESYRREICRAE